MMMMHLATSFVLYPLLLPLASAFSFTTNQPSECGNLVVNWSGGQPPYTLSIFPAFGTQQIFAIPPSAQGSFSTQFRAKAGHQIVVAMSDATGFASGGISPSIVLGQPASNANCNSTDTGPAFFWNSNSATAQCREFDLDGYVETGAVLPVTVTTIVPGGTFQNFTATGNTFAIPKLAVNAGSTVLIALSDAQGRTGGDSDFTTVSQTGDSSCLTGTFPSSTAVASASSTSGKAAHTGTGAPKGTSKPNSSSTHLSGGTIGAIVAGGIVIAGALIAIAIFLRRRRARGSGYTQGGRPDIDMGAEYTATEPMFGNQRYEPEPFILNASLPEPVVYQHEQPPNSASNLMENSTLPYLRDSRVHSFAESSTASSSVGPTSRSSKAGGAREQQRRYIVHTDVADTAQEEEEVVELPPQYSENRLPIPGIPTYTPDPSVAHRKR